MGGKGLAALGAATIALLAGPGTAWGNQEGKAGDSAPAAATSAAEPVTPADSEDTATTPASSENTDTATIPADEPVVAESNSPATEESTEAPVPQPEAATPEATTASQAQAGGQPQAQLEVDSSVTKQLGVPARAKKAAGKAISCATKAAQPTGNGPPPPGCTRIDGGQVNGVHQVIVNGVTITFTFTIVDTPNGPVITWTSDVPFSGTIYVKGGPDWPGFPCTYANATADASGNCHAPLNPNNPNNKFYGVSHITICPPGTPIPPPVTPPGGGSGGGGGGGGGGGAAPQGTAGKEQKGGVRGSEAQGTSPAVASAAAAAAAQGEQLPFTGMNALWLVLIGGMLLGVGTMFRARRS